MSKKNLKEAVEDIEQVKARISSLEQAYQNRRAEVEDDEYWKDVPRGAKLAILSKLDSLQRELDRAKKKLARLETSEVVVEDELPGGLGDDARVSDFAPEQISAGLKVEMEHTKDPKIALEIVLDHLTEDAEYYTKLATIETNPVTPEGEADNSNLDSEDAFTQKQQLQNIVQQLENFAIQFDKTDNTLSDELKDALLKLRNIVDILDEHSSSLFDKKEDDDLSYVVNTDTEESEIEEHTNPLIEEVDEVISEPEAVVMTKSILKDILANKTPYLPDSTNKFPYIIDAEAGNNEELVEILLGFDTKEYGKHFDGWIELKYTVDYDYTPAKVSGARDITPDYPELDINSITIDSIQFYNDANSENYFLSLADGELEALAKKIGDKLIEVR